MIIKIEEDAKAYLKKNSIKKLLIDMVPDLTNSGCGCGKTKKFYTPYIRAMKPDEHYTNFMFYQTDIVDIYLAPRVHEAAEDIITVKLEKNLFIKKIDLEGIRFIIE